MDGSKRQLGYNINTPSFTKHDHTRIYWYALHRAGDIPQRIDDGSTRTSMGLQVISTYASTGKLHGIFNFLVTDAARQMGKQHTKAANENAFVMDQFEH